jgi:hypothetical protein
MNSLVQLVTLQRHRLVVCNLQIRLRVVHNQVLQLVVRNLGLRQEVCIQILQQVVRELQQVE